MNAKTSILAGMLAVMAAPAHAGHTKSTIDKILLYESAMLVYVYPANGVTDPPACHGVNGDYYSFSMSRPMAKEYLAALLAAQARGATVSFTGADACMDQNYSETLRYFYIEG